MTLRILPVPDSPSVDHVIAGREREQRREQRIDVRWDIGLDIIALIRWQKGEFPTFWEAYRAAFHRALGITPEKYAADLEPRRRFKCGSLFDAMFPAPASSERKPLAQVVDIGTATPKKPRATALLEKAR